MQSWNTRFEALEINHLRSPAFAHPMAFEPTALCAAGSLPQPLISLLGLSAACSSRSPRGLAIETRHRRLNYAISEGRTAELIDAPFVSKFLSTTDVSGQNALLKALPSAALFSAPPAHQSLKRALTADH